MSDLHSWMAVHHIEQRALNLPMVKPQTQRVSSNLLRKLKLHILKIQNRGCQIISHSTVHVAQSRSDDESMINTRSTSMFTDQVIQIEVVRSSVIVPSRLSDHQS